MAASQLSVLPARESGPMSTRQMFDRAVILQNAGRFVEAEQLYRQALALQPVDPTLHHCLGLVCYQQGRHVEAELWMDAAVRITPKMPAIRADHGVTLYALGRFLEALAEYDQAIALGLTNPDVINNRGNALVALGRPEEALACFNSVLSLAPRHVQTLNNRGNALRTLGRLELALADFRRAIAIDPKIAQVWVNYAVAAREAGRPDDSLMAADRALALDAGLEAAWNERGGALFALRRYEEALAAFVQVLGRNGNHIEAWLNRGLVLAALQQDEGALACFDQVLRLDSKRAEAMYHRALTLEMRGRVGDAFSAYEALYRTHPGHPYVLSRLANLAQSVCDWPRLDALRGALEGALAEGKVLSPLLVLGISDDPAFQRAASIRTVEDEISVLPPPLWQGRLYNHDRIRIAYLSADFHHHATAILTAELFELHDRSRFEVIGVSYGPDDKSSFRARLGKAFDRFMDVSRLSDREVAKILHDLEVDIVIDLKGHTRSGRLKILAHRPAPVQLHYLGYPGTMGALFVDYVIGDGVTLPERLQPFYDERIVILPHCYQPNDSTRTIACTDISREAAGLPPQGFVFCCFNSSKKISAAIFDIWMSLLTTVPGSVLWLLGGNDHASANLRAAAQARGVDPARLVFAPPLPLDAHHARHRLADLFLDTFPYNAHTTASDALWAGLPVLTLMGQTFAARVAASLLTDLGLHELITETAGDYEKSALTLVRDGASLAALRERLAGARATAPLFGGRRIAADLERAYIQMMEIARRGGSPQSFTVPAI
jgi:predicted O-linked N-acetylglucosamine transferase (SPINDLY family)